MGDYEQRRQAVDPPADEGDDVQRGLVRPVGVFDDEHGRARRTPDLLHDRVHHRPVVPLGYRLGERRGSGRHVPEGTQRARDD